MFGRRPPPDPRVAIKERLLREKSAIDIQDYERKAREHLGLPEVASIDPNAIAGKRKGLIGKTLSATGAVLNSPILFAAPMLLPMIPGLSGAPPEPTYEEKMLDYSIPPDRQRKLDAQQQVMLQQQQAMAMAGGLL
jgi:hypothetical protein